MELDDFITLEFVGKEIGNKRKEKMLKMKCKIGGIY